MTAERLAEQLEQLPALYVDLLAAVIDREHKGSDEVTRGRGRAAGRVMDRPLELNLTILDFLAEPSTDGRLGFARSLLALATVTRAAFGGASPSSMDRQTIGMRYLANHGLQHRLEGLRPESIVEAAQVAESVRYLSAQADRIVDAQHWTPAAAAHVSRMYDEATVGLDDRLYELWRAWRDGCRERLADLADGHPDEMLSLAVAAFDVDRVEYVGLHLDSIRRWYAAAAAGPAQWSDFVAEEVFRLHGHASKLAGEAEQRSRTVEAAECPFCGVHTLAVVVHPPKAACAHRTRQALAAGEDPPADRCCGEFIACTSCSRQWSLQVDPDTGHSEASSMFAAFRAAGWLPRQRTALDDEPAQELAYAV